VLRDRPPGHDWELEPGVTCGDYLFGMLQVSEFTISFCIHIFTFWWEVWFFLRKIIFTINREIFNPAVLPFG
jgi:hypothetical protein